VVLEVSHLTSITDYFVIASGRNAHRCAPWRRGRGKAQGRGRRGEAQEGYATALDRVDYASVIVHVFHQEEREFYNIEPFGWTDRISCHSSPPSSIYITKEIIKNETEPGTGAGPFEKIQRDGRALKARVRREGVMRHFARMQGADEELWGIVGLLHDLDYEKFPSSTA
jgi:ribosomal silencing factor RsfS